MLVLTGTLSTDPTKSTFAFFKDVVGYDLAAFFRRNSARMAVEVQEIVGGAVNEVVVRSIITSADCSVLTHPECDDNGNYVSHNLSYPGC